MAKYSPVRLTFPLEAVADIPGSRVVRILNSAHMCMHVCINTYANTRHTLFRLQTPTSELSPELAALHEDKQYRVLVFLH